jgi:hypothetical protein
VLKRFYIHLLIFFCSITIAAKAQPTFDTIKDCLKHKPHVFGKLDSRNSFIDNSRAKIFGIKIGLDFNERLQFGVGYNQLYSKATNFEKTVFFTNKNNVSDSSLASLHLYYFSACMEYVYYQNKKWELSIPLQFGIGQTYYQYSDLGEIKIIERGRIFIYEPAVAVEYKITRWFGIGAGIGFRFMVTDYKHLNDKFNSPTYAFKTLIYFDEIWDSVLSEIKKRKQKKTETK